MHIIESSAVNVAANWESIIQKFWLGKDEQKEQRNQGKLQPSRNQGTSHEARTYDDGTKLKAGLPDKLGFRTAHLDLTTRIKGLDHKQDSDEVAESRPCPQIEFRTRWKEGLDAGGDEDLGGLASNRMEIGRSNGRTANVDQTEAPPPALCKQ